MAWTRVSSPAEHPQLSEGIQYDSHMCRSISGFCGRKQDIELNTLNKESGNNYTVGSFTVFRKLGLNGKPC